MTADPPPPHGPHVLSGRGLSRPTNSRAGDVMQNRFPGNRAWFKQFKQHSTICTPFWRRPFRLKGILSGDLGGPKYFYSSVRLFFIFVQVLKRNDWSGTVFGYQSLDYKSKKIYIVRAAKYKHEQISRTRPWRDPRTVPGRMISKADFISLS